MSQAIRVFDGHLSRLMLCITAALFTAGGCHTGAKDRQAAPSTGEKVKPGINDELREGDVDKWMERFERESREIYHAREQIVDYVAPRPGTAVADIGAGTGFFSLMLSRRVQPGGRVYAVDIVPQFLEHIRDRASEQAIDNIATVLCTDESVKLPPDSVDLAFICDTYHHFEHPESTMRSIHEALRPGGEMVIIDFIRVPGQSRQWVLDHVRAGQDEVIAEVTEYGFDLVDRPANTGFLQENYIMRFRKSP